VLQQVPVRHVQLRGVIGGARGARPAYIHFCISIIKK
jgi:hypothetical protein